jgi:hypothetical protein
MQEEPTANESPKEVSDKSRFQFSLKALLLMPLWIAVSFCIHAMIGKVALPSILGFWAALSGCVISKLLFRNSYVVVILLSYSSTLAGILFVRLCLPDDPYNVWISGNLSIYWAFLSYTISIMISLIMGWFFLPRKKNTTRNSR